MSIKAKMVVDSITHRQHGNASVRLECQYDESIREDQRFYDATPSGHIEMTINNPAVIEKLQPGKAFYLYLEEVDPVIPKDEGYTNGPVEAA